MRPLRRRRRGATSCVALDARGRRALVDRAPAMCAPPLGRARRSTRGWRTSRRNASRSSPATGRATRAASSGRGARAAAGTRRWRPGAAERHVARLTERPRRHGAPRPGRSTSTPAADRATLGARSSPAASDPVQALRRSWRDGGRSSSGAAAGAIASAGPLSPDRALARRRLAARPTSRSSSASAASAVSRRLERSRAQFGRALSPISGWCCRLGGLAGLALVAFLALAGCVGRGARRAREALGVHWNGRSFERRPARRRGRPSSRGIPCASARRTATGGGSAATGWSRLPRVLGELRARVPGGAARARRRPRRAARRRLRPALRRPGPRLPPERPGCGRLLPTARRPRAGGPPPRPGRPRPRPGARRPLRRARARGACSSGRASACADPARSCRRSRTTTTTSTFACRSRPTRAWVNQMDGLRAAGAERLGRRRGSRRTARPRIAASGVRLRLLAYGPVRQPRRGQRDDAPLELGRDARRSSASAGSLPGAREPGRGRASGCASRPSRVLGSVRLTERGRTPTNVGSTAHSAAARQGRPIEAIRHRRTRGRRAGCSSSAASTATSAPACASTQQLASLVRPIAVDLWLVPQPQPGRPRRAARGATRAASTSTATSTPSRSPRRESRGS